MEMLFESVKELLRAKKRNAESILNQHYEGRLLLIIIPYHVHIFLSLTQPPHAGVEADKLFSMIALKCQRH